MFLVLMEFTGLGTDGSFARAVPVRPREHTLTIDPLTVCGHHASLPERAAAISKKVLRTGACDVILAASCSGSMLLAPVAAALNQTDVRVAACLAVDPAPVTVASLAGAIDDLAEALGSPARPDWSRSTPTFEQTDEALRGWIERHIEQNDIPEEMQDILRDDLYERYRAWLGYLFCALDQSWSEPACPANVFTIRDEESLSPVFGAGAALRTRRYIFDGRASLGREDVGADLRTTLTAAGWPGQRV